ncbi:transposase-like protein [Paraphoma chrysanthemicola]|nr:transposase-like protein [Paraphoma chrysanthemicola]
MLLQAALDLRHAFDGYIDKWVEADCVGEELSLEDWVILEKIKLILEKLSLATKTLQLLFAILDKKNEAGKDDTMMALMYNSGWAKLDKYYCLTDESLSYVAAIVLHPSHIWHYIQENWKKE